MEKEIDVLSSLSGAKLSGAEVADADFLSAAKRRRWFRFGSKEQTPREPGCLTFRSPAALARL